MDATKLTQCFGNAQRLRKPVQPAAAAEEAAPADAKEEL
jgi:hypothetical protein